jgi:hypothetical protein
MNIRRGSDKGISNIFGLAINNIASDSMTGGVPEFIKAENPKAPDSFSQGDLLFSKYLSEKKRAKYADVSNTKLEF